VWFFPRTLREPLAPDLSQDRGTAKWTVFACFSVFLFPLSLDPYLSLADGEITPSPGPVPLLSLAPQRPVRGSVCPRSSHTLPPLRAVLPFPANHSSEPFAVCFLVSMFADRFPVRGLSFSRQRIHLPHLFRGNSSPPPPVTVCLPPPGTYFRHGVPVVSPLSPDPFGSLYV